MNPVLSRAHQEGIKAGVAMGRREMAEEIARYIESQAPDAMQALAGRIRDGAILARDDVTVAGSPGVKAASAGAAREITRAGEPAATKGGAEAAGAEIADSRGAIGPADHLSDVVGNSEQGAAGVAAGAPDRLPRLIRTGCRCPRCDEEVLLMSPWLDAQLLRAARAVRDACKQAAADACITMCLSAEAGRRQAAFEVGLVDLAAILRAKEGE